MDTKIQSKNLYKAFELLKQKKFDEAEKTLGIGLKEAETLHDELMMGIYNSAFGLLFKYKKEFRKAWKYYENAEKLIPEDPSIKLITSKLLIDYFSQYDIAIKKMDKVLTMAANDPMFVHQALCVKGLAYLKKGERNKAIECLKGVFENGFKGIQSIVNVDFKLVESFIKKKLEIDLCKKYLIKASQFAEKNKETKQAKTLNRLLQSFPKMNEQ